MSKNIYRNLFVLFCVLNIALLAVIYTQSQSLKAETANVLRTEEDGLAELSRLIKENIDLSALFTDHVDETGLKLLLVFPIEFCGAATDYELSYLKKIYASYPNSLVVGQIAREKYNLQSMISGVTDSLSPIREITIPRDIAGQIINQRIYLVSENRSIILSRVSIFGDVNRALSFYEKVEALFSLLSDKTIRSRQIAEK